MLLLKELEQKQLSDAAFIYKQAYAKEPYNERISVENAMASLRAMLSKYDFKIALEHNNELIGFIFASTELWKGKKVACIEEFVVAPEFQGKGFGGEALKKFEEMLRKQGYYGITLLSHKKSKAHNFYLKRGFKETKWVLLWKKL